MGRRSLKDLQAAVRQAEAELETATKLPDVREAAKRLMRAKAALIAAEEVAGAGPTRRGHPVRREGRELPKRFAVFV